MSRKCNKVIKDENYQEIRANLTNTQLKKLKSEAKNKRRTTLRLNKKNFADEELPHELFITTRQTTKLRNAFANNMTPDIKLRKNLGNLRKKALANVAIPLARGNLPGSVSKLTSSALNKFGRK